MWLGICKLNYIFCSKMIPFSFITLSFLKECSNQLLSSLSLLDRYGIVVTTLTIVMRNVMCFILPINDKDIKYLLGANQLKGA